MFIQRPDFFACSNNDRLKLLILSTKHPRIVDTLGHWSTPCACLFKPTWPVRRQLPFFDGWRLGGELSVEYTVQNSSNRHITLRLWAIKYCWFNLYFPLVNRIKPEILALCNFFTPNSVNIDFRLWIIWREDCERKLNERSPTIQIEKLPSCHSHDLSLN